MKILKYILEAKSAVRTLVVLSLVLVSSFGGAQELTYENVRKLAADEFIRLAGASWEKQDYRSAVTFGMKARRIQSEVFGENDPIVAVTEKRVAAAIDMLRQAAETGGNKYLLMPNDELEKLRKSGDTGAVHELGLRNAYALGGLSGDLSRAIGLFEISAAAGNPDSLFEMGKALMELRSRTELTAQWAAQGPQETSLTPIAAPAGVELQALSQAAEKGHVAARALVGVALIEQAIGNPDPEAMKLAEEGWKALRETARDGSAWGQFLLANCMAKGFGITQSRTTALTYARQAAVQGMREGQALLAELALEGFAMTPDNEGWVALVCAAEQDYWLAYYPLGLRLAEGNGIKADREAGRRWLEKAAEQGHLPAADALRKLQTE